MIFTVKEEELKQLENHLASLYEPINPRKEFVDHLRERIMDPAPKVLKAQSYTIDWRFIVIFFIAMVAFFLMMITIWKVVITKLLKSK
jgi:hypothetical protein